jgi:hypothetical protein
MQKNKNIILQLIAIIIFLGICLPDMALAWDIPTDPAQIRLTKTDSSGVKHTCPGPDLANPDKGFTVRLIPCILNAVTYATTSILGPFSAYMLTIINAVFTLAIATWGVLILSGNVAAISQGGMMLALKIGAIAFFANNFGGLYPVMLNVMEELLNIIANPVTIDSGPTGISLWQGACTPPEVFSATNEKIQNIMSVWHILDCYIDLLIGGIIAPTPAAQAAAITTGIIGFIVGMLFSSSIGLFIAFIGFYVIIMTLFTIARAVYIFITAYIAFSFMAIISPIFIPCILFRSTREYFADWLRLTISFIIQPIFLFGYLVMFLVAFNTVFFVGHQSLYYAIAGDASQEDVNTFKIGPWLSSKGIYEKILIGKDYVAIDQGGDKVVTGGVSKFEDTGLTDLQAIRRAFKVGMGGSEPLDFFETGVMVNSINWERLAQVVKPSEYSAAVGSDTALAKFYQDYKIRVFLAFLMAAVVMYIFYSLLEYLPYIGSATMGDLGYVPTLGAGSLAAPGSKQLGGMGK